MNGLRGTLLNILPAPTLMGPPWAQDPRVVLTGWASSPCSSEAWVMWRWHRQPLRSHRRGHSWGERGACEDRAWEVNRFKSTGFTGFLWEEGSDCSKSRMDYVVLWQRSEGTDLTTRFNKLTSMSPSLKPPLVYRLRLFSSARLKTHGFAGSGCITSWLLLFPWLFSAYGWARERITSSPITPPITSYHPLLCVCVCVCVPTRVYVCVHTQLTVYL